ncbi:MAG: MarC family protein [Simkaniaceae bacterium]
MSIKTIIISLFIVINVLGNIPLYLGLLARFDLKHQRKIIFREMCIALGILLTFSFAGDYILSLMGISPPIIGIAGGTLLFIIALHMVFPKHDANESKPMQEPFVFPLATPIIAGPGSITAVMVYTAQLQNSSLMVLSILLAWLPSLAIVLLSSNLKRLIGNKGLIACERVGGMLITLLAVQMITGGLIDLVKKTFF